MNSNTHQAPQTFRAHLPSHLASLALAVGLCLVQAGFAEQTKNSASPFGLELGQATCALAKTQLSPVKVETLPGGDILVETTNPENLYPGASQVIARCRESRVIAVQVKASKGGLDANASRAAFTILHSKYKLAQGGPMPSLGDGYAQFVAGKSVIEQSAPHLDFDFTISYMEKSFYDELTMRNKTQQQKAADQKQTSL